MGNLLAQSGKTGETPEIPPLLEETQIFALWTIKDVRELMKRFQTQIHGYALVEAQFEMILAFKPEVAEHVELELLFDILDNDHDGRMDGLEFLAGLAMCCTASFEEKCRFCFELFDFNFNSLLSEKELIMMMISCLCGMNLLTGGGEELEPDIEIFEDLASQAMCRGDINADGQISYEEFVQWARSNRQLMAGVEALNRIALDAKLDVQSDDSAPETENDDFSDTEDEIENARKPEMGDQNLAIVPWLTQIQEPTNFKPRKDINRGPKTNLELSWVYGFNCRTHSNNVRYLFHSSFLEDVYCVFVSAAVAMVYDFKTKSQIFYLGHQAEITAIAVHPNQQIVVTGDKKSYVHVWTLDDEKKPTAILVFQSMVKNGIQQIAFSPSGERLAVVGKDVDHTICFHNALNGEVIASGKGISDPNNVNDIAFSLNGAELIMVGKNQIRFYINTNTNKRSLEWRLGKIGSIGKRQNFYSAAYIKNNEVVVGCASGEIYRFKDMTCTQIIQAHGIKDPVLCLFYNAAESTLASGGKDSVIKTWDMTLKEIGAPLDLSEDIDGDGKAESGSLNSAVKSIQHLKGKLLIGTLGSDIYEAVLSNLPTTPYTLQRIAWGHSLGELWGLDAHPGRDEFCTVGDDCTIRLWSLRTHEQINGRLMPKAARSVAYSPSGLVLCVGMINGEVSLLEAASPGLRAYATWQHSDKMINDIKFSPDNNYLAVASADTNIYLYKSTDQKNFVRLAVCKGHSGAVTHLDFSANSQFIQSNGMDGALLYWNLSGNQITHSFSMKDLNWATNTCIFGWHLQGVWPKGSDFTDINTAIALPDIGDIITGDDFHKVNVFAYPSVSETAVHQSYSGHSSHVTSIKVSWNRRYVISIGGGDRAVLLWKHEVEAEDSDDEQEVPLLIQKSQVNNETAAVEENPSAAKRSIQQEAANLGWSVNDLKNQLESEGIEFQLPTGDQSEAAAPWRSKVIEPSKVTISQNSTDVDLELSWVYGHRCHDCRNNIFYSSDGSVVYNVANIAVLYHKPTAKQHFLYGPHIDEVISIAMHPAGQIFATGEAGRKASVIVWNSVDMKVLSKLDDIHEGGIALLAFNSTGNVLASIGLDAKNTLTIHDWNKDIFLVSAATSPERVLCCNFLTNDQLNLHNPNGLTSKRGSGRNTKNTIKAGGVAVETKVCLEGKDVVVVGGEKGFLKFFWWQGQNLSSQTAIWGNDRKLVYATDKVSAIMCVASTNSSVCVTGLANGNLLIWKDCELVNNMRFIMDKFADEMLKTFESMAPETISRDLQEHTHSFQEEVPDEKSNYPHKHNPILAMYAIRGTIETVGSLSEHLESYYGSSRYLTGDKDGNVCIWRLVEAVSGELTLLLMKHFNLRQFRPNATTFVVRSLCERDGLILIGNNSAEIFEVHEESLEFVPSYLDEIKRDKREKLITIPENLPLAINTKGLSAVPSAAESIPVFEVPVNQLSTGHSGGEIWGLAIHPKQPLFFTSGDDHFLKCWNLESNTLVSFAVLPDKSRAISIHPNGQEMSVSFNSGHIIVVDLAIFFPSDDRKSLLAPGNKAKNVTKELGIEEIWKDKSPRTPRASMDFTNNNNNNNANKESLVVAALKASKSCKFLENSPKQWCQTLKYSCEPFLLLAGCHDSKVYVYDVKEKYKFLYTFNQHTMSVNHLDFGILVSIDKIFTPKDPQELLIFSKEEPNKPKELIGNKLITITERYDEATNKIFSLKTTQMNYLPTAQLPDTTETIEETREITINDIVVQSTSAAEELLYWKASNGSLFTSLNDIKDVEWISYSCPYGWPVQGVYNPDDPLVTGNSIFTVARSHSWELVPVIAMGDIYGRLRLFNYPCVQYGAPDKCYKAHTGKITRIAFSADDHYLISLGATDRSVIVWKTDIEEEVRSRKAYTAVPVAAPAGSKGSSLSFTPSQPMLHPPAEPNARPVETFEDSIEYLLPAPTPSSYQPGAGAGLDEVPSGGDEFQAIKPWKSAIREPSKYKEDPEVAATKYGKLPKAVLELKFAYGYRGYDTRNNLFYGSHLNEIVYCTAGLGVVYNSKENKQIFNNDHNADIISIAVHPDGHVVATGDVGKLPKINLWDINTGTTIRTIRFHKMGVSHLSFHPLEKNLLISCGLDDDRLLVIHNITNGTIVGKSKIGKGIMIQTLKVSPTASCFLTAGKNHLKFWDLPSDNSPGGELSSKTGIYNLKSVKTRTVCACAYLGSDPVTGMDDGSLLLWKDRTNTKAIANAHHGPITAMTSILSKSAANNNNNNNNSSNQSNSLSSSSTSNSNNRTVDGRDSGPRIVTGSKDGFVHIWDIQLNCVWTLNLNDTALSSLTSALGGLGGPGSGGGGGGGGIGSNSANVSSAKEVVPVNPAVLAQNAVLTPCLSQVQALDIKDNLLLIGTKSAEIFEINLIGSSTSNTLSSSITTNSFQCHMKGHFLERSELWGLSVHPKLAMLVTAGDDMTVRLWDYKNNLCKNIVNIQSKVRCLQYSPDGAHIAIGTFEGKLVVLSDDLMSVYFSNFISPAWIHCLTYSPNGQQLSIGSHDSNIYLVETKSYSCRYKCKGHHSFITAIDYSEDNLYLQSTSGDYELLFWNSLNGQQLFNINMIRDIVWATLTCPLGWAVQGIWPKNSDGTDVNSVDRSSNQQLLVTGDDFHNVKLFQYPVIKENAVNREYHGHSQHVMKVKFSPDGRFVFSVGGIDKTLLQYEVKYS